MKVCSLSSFVFLLPSFTWSILIHVVSYTCQEEDHHCRLFYGSKADIASTTLRLVSLLFSFCRYPTPKAMAENAVDVDHGEEFISQNGGEDTGAESKHGDVSMDLPMEGNADLSIQVERKSGNEMVVRIVYTLKLVEMN
jgi:hypothetical protein